MTGKLLAYHLKSPRVPLVVRVPQFENHCYKMYMDKFTRIEIMFDKTGFRPKLAKQLQKIFA